MSDHDTRPDRREWVEGLDRMRREGMIDADDENTLIRHMDEHHRTLQAELERIKPEYEARIARDGQASADQWLAEAARALGEQAGARSRRVLDSLSVARNGAGS